MYRDISMAQRLGRIGELLAKGVFLCLEKEKAVKVKTENVSDDKAALIPMRNNVKSKNQFVVPALTDCKLY